MWDIFCERWKLDFQPLKLDFCERWKLDFFCHHSEGNQQKLPTTQVFKLNYYVIYKKDERQFQNKNRQFQKFVSLLSIIIDIYIDIVALKYNKKR